MAEQRKRAKPFPNLSQTGVKCPLRLLTRGTKDQENAPVLYLPLVTAGGEWLTEVSGGKNGAGEGAAGFFIYRPPFPADGGSSPPPLCFLAGGEGGPFARRHLSRSQP